MGITLHAVNIQGHCLCSGTVHRVRYAYGIRSTIAAVGNRVGKVVATAQCQGYNLHADIALLGLCLAC